MRRSLPVAALSIVVIAAGVGLTGCAQAPANRYLQRYYDPGGLFSAELPLANTAEVAKPGQQVAQGVQLLAGVTSSAPSTSGAPPGAFSPPDRSVFIVWALGSASFTSTSDLAGVLSKDPSFDEQVSEPFGFVDGRGTIVEGTYTTSTGSFDIAGGFLEHHGVGYAVLEEFPSGQWDAQRWDFLQVLGSLRVQTPPGLGTIDLASP